MTALKVQNDVIIDGGILCICSLITNLVWDSIRRRAHDGEPTGRSGKRVTSTPSEISRNTGVNDIALFTVSVIAGTYL